MDFDKALKIVELESKYAIKTHNSFNSLHEAYAVILEELEELWSEIKKKPLKRNYKIIGNEAVQVAAMILRLLVDFIDDDLFTLRGEFYE